MSSGPPRFKKKTAKCAKSDREGQVPDAFRAFLGEFMVIHTGAKIKIARKLADKIAGENDVDKMMELGAKLNDVIFSAQDVTQLDAKIGALLAMLQKHATSFITLRQKWVTAQRQEMNKQK